MIIKESIEHYVTYKENHFTRTATGQGLWNDNEENLVKPGHLLFELENEFQKQINTEEA